MRAYRERIKADPGLQSTYLEKDRQRKRELKEEMSKSELKQNRKQNAKAAREYRGRKADEKKSENHNTTEVVRAVTPYKSRSSLGKAVAKARRALPFSPNKQRAVLRELVGQTPLAPIQAHQRSERALSDQTVEIVRTFYENNSRISPGKADYLIIKDSTGGKEKVQKRHMVMTVGEAFETFKEQNPEVTIGKSKFASLRPMFVLLVSKMPHNTCGCKYPNNIILMLEALHRACQVIPLYSRNGFLQKCVCDVGKFECMRATCDVCNVTEGILFRKNVSHQVSPEEKAKQITWQQWAEDDDGYLIKKNHEGTVEQALTIVQNQLPQFLWHAFLKNEQATAYEEHKAAALHMESTFPLLQMDFAENYTTVFQDETQSAHWRKRQISIYTAMYYYRGSTSPVVIVSDTRDHEKCSVATFTHILLKMISRLPQVEGIQIWTDGPSSQFKNKYIFSYLSYLKQMGIPIESWNFFATSHGKGPNDALGGNVKRMVHQRVLARKANVYDASSFVNLLESLATPIKCVLVQQEQIDKFVEDHQLRMLWGSLKAAIPGTINTHCVKVGPSSITAKYFTNATFSTSHGFQYLEENIGDEFTDPPGPVDKVPSVPGSVDKIPNVPGLVDKVPNVPVPGPVSGPTPDCLDEVQNVSVHVPNPLDKVPNVPGPVPINRVTNIPVPVPGAVDEVSNVPGPVTSPVNEEPNVPDPIPSPVPVPGSITSAFDNVPDVPGSVPGPVDELPIVTGPAAVVTDDPGPVEVSDVPSPTVTDIAVPAVPGPSNSSSKQSGTVTRKRHQKTGKRKSKKKNKGVASSGIPHSEEDAQCPVCQEWWSAGVGDMIQCSSCKQWIHEICAFVMGPVYICDFCA